MSHTQETSTVTTTNILHKDIHYTNSPRLRIPPPQKVYKKYVYLSGIFITHSVWYDIIKQMHERYIHLQHLSYNLLALRQTATKEGQPTIVVWTDVLKMINML